MPSSKGKPTDPKLREQVKKEVQSETNKDGSGKGQWSAWKSAKLSKEYEKRGGDYENEAGSKNEPKKGVPEEKPGRKRQREVEGMEKNGGGDDTGSAKDEDASGQDGKAAAAAAAAEEEEGENKAQKRGAKQARKESTSRNAGQKKGGAKTARKAEKAEKAPREGTRRSARIQQAEGQGGGRGKKQKTDYVQF
ncbi:hypothetical protein UCRNP2_8741 [Neofusicoccum parvum UCRNP2]|uniref:Uncharacterized protein n=1 Tax=Botryosphaeria parva (strain UCR-NP2) TaxID=1287680 RepID=R1G8S7_BOTPV|nr:hypothetical protein UCRNP2_8741 [Neofusicoccum parvum UCRNP2]